jgi:SAM-dependent methyltransferase
VTVERIDPYVQAGLVKTHGHLYGRTRGRLERYPIPELPLAPGNGRTLLDIGCNWGRWTIAATRAGYRATGIDPSSKALAAAERVAADLGVEARYVRADARSLPFPDGSFDAVFSFSVLQHFARADVELAVGEIARVLAPGGECWVQMAGANGLLGLLRRVQRGFREGRDFEVRYWRPAQLRRAFAPIGEVEVAADAYFTLNAQAADLDLLPAPARGVVRVSEGLRRLSVSAPWLVAVADSFVVRCRKAP